MPRVPTPSSLPSKPVTESAPSVHSLPHPITLFIIAILASTIVNYIDLKRGHPNDPMDITMPWVVKTITVSLLLQKVLNILTRPSNEAPTAGRVTLPPSSKLPRRK